MSTQKKKNIIEIDKCTDSLNQACLTRGSFPYLEARARLPPLFQPTKPSTPRRLFLACFSYEHRADKRDGGGSLKR